MAYRLAIRDGEVYFWEFQYFKLSSLVVPADTMVLIGALRPKFNSLGQF
ncbi:hypothetical protein VINI7043_17109 [Vibrio nigripulchritudo ATCC 27043]|nr:hypothetical protein VINI7043_17109 [Vibrio nigripulchritudo ATCC 27043]